MKPVGPNRRVFLQAAAAISVPYFVPQSVFANPPSDRLNHASIGVDGMGWSDLSSLASHPRFQLIACCDVDRARMQKATEAFPQARRYQDWRELLAEESNKIDSVNVSVPDHMHAAISLTAIGLGKHVYCQKPLTHEIAEARALRLAAEAAQVKTQMGNQIQSESVYRSAVQALRQGMIGKVSAVHAWAGATFPQRGRPDGEDPIPSSLDWDKWLGVAPVRPFKNGIYHPFNWRGWQHFGGGPIGDFGCHILDTPFKALGLTAPLTIRAEVPREWRDNPAWNQENWPDWEILHYEFPATEMTAGATLPITWYDGGKKPPTELFGFTSPDQQPPGSGALFIGEDGKLLVPHVGPPQLLPGSKQLGAPLPAMPGFSHYHAFVDACLGQSNTGSSFTYAGPLAEATLLGTIAVRFPDQALAWNAIDMRITNSDAANRCVSREYRTGWELAAAARH